MVRVLVVGSVSDGLSAVIEKVTKLHSGPAGPFDLCFLIGPVCDAETGQFSRGSQSSSVPLYILTGPGDEAVTSMCEGPVTSLGSGVFVLGRGADVAELCGLRVAWLSGGYDQFVFGTTQATSGCYTRAAVASLSEAVKRDGRAVDVLLTSDWPLGFATNVPKQSAPGSLGDLAKVGAGPVAGLADAVCPRYHFVGGRQHALHYQRPPYINSRVSHVTRLISIAPVGNEAKQKSMYAVQVQPAASLPRAELEAVPADATASPFVAAVERLVPQGGGKNKRPAPDGLYQAPKRANAAGKGSSGGPGPVARGPCWFCLSSPQVEKHLIVSIGDNAYIAAPKGPLHPDHMLILPVSHHTGSLGQLDPAVQGEIETLKVAVARFYESKGLSAVFYERNLPAAPGQEGNHMHIQAVPVPRGDTLTSLRSRLIEAGSAQGIAFEGMTQDQLDALDTGFLAYQIPDGAEDQHLVHRVPPQDASGKRHPMIFARAALAQAMGFPEKADWKKVAETKERETELIKALRKAFQPFDPAK